MLISQGNLQIFAFAGVEKLPYTSVALYIQQEDW